MSQYLGDISAYALAVSQGYTGTEEEYAELMASYATVGQTAVTAAQTATTKASEAATSATTATNKATEATTAATTATNKAAEAQADADAAALDASQAMSAASTATTKATEATTAAATAVSAKDDAVAANTAAQSAKTAAQTAQTGAETAAASVQSSAAQIQTNADEISELKEELTAKLDGTYTIHDDVYVNRYTGKLVSLSGSKALEVEVVYGMSVLYKFTYATPDSRGLAFYDSTGVMIASYQALTTAQLIDVPDGAVVLKATVRTKDDVVINSIYDGITNINGEIGSLKEKYVGVNNSSIELISGHYAHYQSGNIGNLAALSYAEYPVIGGAKLVYKFTRNSPDSAGLHFVDSNGTYISGVQALRTAQNITAPSNAVMCRATVTDVSQLSYVNDSVGNAIIDKINEVGNTVFTNTEIPLEIVEDKTGYIDLFLHVGCIGDSLASGEAYWNDGGEQHGADFYQYSWGQFLARKTGNTYYNWSSGGQTTKTWLTSAYATQCFDGQHLCEAYIIGLGQNDSGNDYAVGTSSDIDMSDYNNNADTFYGSYGKIIQKIKEVQPQAKIFVVTDMIDRTESKGYNNAIRNLANLFDNVYVVDLRTYGFKYYNLGIMKAQLRAGHFNAVGYKMCAMMIANYVDWIVKNKYTEFTQIELIGTGHSWTPTS